MTLMNLRRIVSFPVLNFKKGHNASSTIPLYYYPLNFIPGVEPNIGTIYGIYFNWYTKTMQKIATRIFIYSSIAFGVIGIILIIIEGPDADNSVLYQTTHKLLFTTVCIILPSFALSVAGKYLSDKS